MKTQDEYDKELSHFYRKVSNHEEAFDVLPEDKLVLYSSEWDTPDSVYETLQEASESPETIYICDWQDDSNDKYFTYIYYDDDEYDTVCCVTRTSVYDNILDVPSKVIDAKWHVVRIIKEDGGVAYIWESYPMDPDEFMTTYTDWVQRHGTWTCPEPDTNTESEDDDQTETSDDKTEPGSDSDSDYGENKIDGLKKAQEVFEG